MFTEPVFDLKEDGYAPYALSSAHIAIAPNGGVVVRRGEIDKILAAFGNLPDALDWLGRQAWEPPNG